MYFPPPPPFSYSHRPWYNSIIRASGLEVVLILDLNDLFDVKMDTEGLRAAATTVLDSLTIGDKVGRSTLL